MSFDLQHIAGEATIQYALEALLMNGLRGVDTYGTQHMSDSRLLEIFAYQ